MEENTNTNTNTNDGGGLVLVLMLVGVMLLLVLVLGPSRDVLGWGARRELDGDMLQRSPWQQLYEQADAA